MEREEEAAKSTTHRVKHQSARTASFLFHLDNNWSHLVTWRAEANAVFIVISTDPRTEPHYACGTDDVVMGVCTYSGLAATLRFC